MLDVLRQYNGDSLYLAAFAVSLGILIYKGRRQPGSTGKKAAAAVLLAAVLIFNGPAYWLMGKITEKETYYRFFWMLPVLFLIAYQLTEAFASKQKIQVSAALGAFLLCLGFGWNFFISSGNLNIPENIYGISQDAVEIGDAVAADWSRDHDWEDSGEAERPAAAFDMYMVYQVRAYEPRICWAVTRKAYLYYGEHGCDFKKYARQQHILAAVNEGLKEDSGELRSSLDKIGVDYLVIRTEFDMDSYLSEISVYPAAHTRSYTIYRVE